VAFLFFRISSGSLNYLCLYWTFLGIWFHSKTKNYKYTSGASWEL